MTATLTLPLYTKSDGTQYYARGGTTLKSDGFTTIGITQHRRLSELCII